MYHPLVAYIVDTLFSQWDWTLATGTEKMKFSLRLLSELSLSMNEHTYSGCVWGDEEDFSVHSTLNGLVNLLRRFPGIANQHTLKVSIAAVHFCRFSRS